MVNKFRFIHFRHHNLTTLVLNSFLTTWNRPPMWEEAAYSNLPTLEKNFFS